jgi:putative acetyltransferase
MSLFIRQEHPEDFADIRDVTQRAFTPMPFYDGHDQDLPERFRKAGELQLSLVAVLEDKVVGHVALTKATHESQEQGWFALGPIAVEPEWQRKGIGTALIAQARNWLQSQKAKGCILMGDPGYYTRHGFKVMPDHCPVGEPSEYFMALQLDGPVPKGRFAFSRLFYEQ